MNEELKKNAVNKISSMVHGSKIFSVYEYDPRGCKAGMWEEIDELKSLIADKIGIDPNSRDYTVTNRVEQLGLHTVVLKISSESNDPVRFVTNGVQLINLRLSGYDIDVDTRYAVNGGYDWRLFNLSRGDYLGFGDEVYAIDFVEDGCPDTKNFLIVCDQIDTLAMLEQYT